MGIKKKKRHGCGPNFLRKLIPNTFYDKFENSCAQHDKDYEEKKESRKVIDKRFLDNMKKEADNKADWFWAYTYYGLVRSYGWLYWLKA